MYAVWNGQGHVMLEVLNLIMEQGLKPWVDGWIVPFPTDDKSRGPQLWRSFWADTPECFAALRAVAQKAAARPSAVARASGAHGMPAGDAVRGRKTHQAN
jgi:hypothetical protein